MNFIFWLDMEMSGLDCQKDRILEIALKVTDFSFQIFKTYESIVYQEQNVLNSMDQWCQINHEKNGLTAQIPFGKPESTVEQDLITIIQEFSPNEKAILAGNSIGQDKKFIESWMPQLNKLLHYRSLDVSSFKILFENKFHKKYEKSHKHRAAEDITESIKELQFYLQFIKTSSPL
jgi:oligoribonuclease